MKRLRIGQVYRTTDTDEEFRVIERTNSQVYLVFFENKTTVIPKAFKTEMIEDRLEEGTIEEIQDPYLKFNLEEETETQKQKTDLYYEVLNSVWKDLKKRALLLDRTGRKQIIEELSESLKLSPNSTRRLLGRFWRGGMSRNSLVPEYKNRGGLQEKGKKRGVKRANQTEGIPITNKERALFERYYQKYYIKKKKSFMTTYNFLIQKEYSRKVKDKSGEITIIPLAPDEKPSYRQFYYWFSKRRDPHEDIYQREGRSTFYNDFKVNGESTLERAYGPAFRYEIDCTHLNITVVSELDREKVIGRPILYSAIDVYTRMVVGFCLSIKNESWETTEETIINIGEDKVEFCKRYGIDIAPEDWPCKHFPKSLFMDNGAAKSPNILQFAHTYHVELEDAESYAPRRKPNIERKHLDFKQIIEEFLPGADPKERKRGQKDPRLDATLTPYELTRQVIRIILYFNHNVIKDYPLDAEMLKAGIEATPAQLWKWGETNGNFFGKESGDLNELRYVLLPQDDRVVSKKGIRFKNHYYIGKSFESLKFLDNNRKEKIHISYDPHNINYIYVKGPEGFLQLEISKTLSSNVLTYDDLEALIPKEEISDKYSKENLIYQLEQENREAARKTTSTLTQRRKELKNISQNRQEYLEETEKEEMNSSKKQTPTPKSGSVSEQQNSYDQDRQAFLERKRLERKNERTD